MSRRLKENIERTIETTLGSIFESKNVSFKIEEANREGGYASIYFVENTTNESTLLEMCIMKSGGFGSKIVLGADNSLGRLLRENIDDIEEATKGVKEDLGIEDDNNEVIMAPDNIVEQEDDDLEEQDDEIIEKKRKKEAKKYKKEQDDLEEQDDDLEEQDDDDLEEKKSKRKKEAKKSKKEQDDKDEMEEDSDEDDKKMESLKKRIAALEEAITDNIIADKQKDRYIESLETKLFKFQEDKKAERKKSLNEILED